MAEADFPGLPATSTDLTSSTVVQTNVRFNRIYLTSVPGILKVIQIVLNIIGIIAIEISNFSMFPEYRFFIWISIIGLCSCVILLCVHLIHFVEKFYKIPWQKIEIGYCTLWTVLYLIAAVFVAIDGLKFAVAVCVGFVAMLAYGIDAFMKWKPVCAGELEQDRHVLSKQTTSEVNEPPSAA